MRDRAFSAAPAGAQRTILPFLNTVLGGFSCTREPPSLTLKIKLLPRTNCRECGLPTCMVFAALAVEGVKDHNSCPALPEENKQALAEYLAQFNFD